MVSLIEILQKYFPLEGESRPWDYLYAAGNPRDALLYFRLFNPEFVEFDECVFFKELMVTEDDRRKYLQEKNNSYWGSPNVLIDLYNRVELLHVFSSGIELEEGEEDVLADALMEAWSASLHYQFPQRRFEVYKIDEPDEELIVGFREERGEERIETYPPHILEPRPGKQFGPPWVPRQPRPDELPRGY